MIRPERSGPLGATCDDEGVTFALYSSSAEAVELCLFDENGSTSKTHFLPDCDAAVWCGYLPGCRPGQRYGYRVHGRWSPQEGLRHNPAKLLIDPWARRLDGGLEWSSELFDYDRAAGPGRWRKSGSDSAPVVPLCVVVAADGREAFRRPGVPWSEMVIYEANVRGYTMRHPGLSEAERGRLAGLSNGRILAYIY